MQHEDTSTDSSNLSSFTTVSVTTPVITPEINAATALNTAKNGPIIPYVAIRLSTPVCGVDVRNEVTAPFEAPFFFKYIAVGTTPHEHKGSGTPMIEALITDPIDFLPILLIIHSLFTNACSSPVKKIPITI